LGKEVRSLLTNRLEPCYLFRFPSMTRLTNCSFYLDKGIGYYSLYCRDTYDILIKRIDKMIASKKRVYFFLICLLCLTIIGILCIPSYQKEANKEIEDLQDAKLLATARRDSANPSAALSLPKEVEKRLKKHRSNNTSNNAWITNNTGGDAGGYYYNDHTYYSSAAACGAGGGYYDGGGGGGGGDGGDAGA